MTEVVGTKKVCQSGFHLDVESGTCVPDKAGQ